MTLSEKESAEDKEPVSTKRQASLFKLTLSTMAAAFGVQSKKNLEEDFTQSSPLPFILAGILFTVLFVLSLILIVRAVLKYAA